jgi:hypothetical protein
MIFYFLVLLLEVRLRGSFISSHTRRTVRERGTVAKYFSISLDTTNNRTIDRLSLKRSIDFAVTATVLYPCVVHLS